MSEILLDFGVYSEYIMNHIIGFRVTSKQNLKLLNLKLEFTLKVNGIHLFVCLFIYFPVEMWLLLHERTPYIVQKGTGSGSIWRLNLKKFVFSC